MELGEFKDLAAMQRRLRQWLNEVLAANNGMRDKAWSESLAVGSEDFVTNMQTFLGTKATNRKVTEIADKHALREQSAPYNTVLGTENSDLTLDNRLFWDDLYLESMSYPGPPEAPVRFPGGQTGMFQVDYNYS